MITGKGLFTLIFLLLSGLCYGLAFLFPNSLWWLLFLYPFFFLCTPNIIGFFGAFFWSFIAYSLHLSGIAIALYQMNIPLLIIIGMFFYLPLTTAFIFILVKKIAFYIKTKIIRSSISPIVINSISLFIHRIWINYAILIPFGRFEGYIFMNPLILLVDTPLQATMQWYNFDILSCIFYSTITIITLCIFEKNKTKYCITTTILILLILFPAAIEKQERPIPKWIHSICTIPLFFPDPKNLTTISTIIQNKIKLSRQNNPQKTLFVLPEGAINCPLSSNQIEKIFGTDNENDLILCSSSFKKQKLRNCCFFLKQAICHEIYYKRHALPVTERPIWYQKNHTHIWPSKNRHPVFIVNEKLSLVPYICSDFFFNTTQDDTFQHIPIIALCNDIWFSGFSSYIQQLMIKTAQLKAIYWQREIVYVAYSTACYINTNGIQFPLFQIK